MRTAVPYVIALLVAVVVGAAAVLALGRLSDRPAGVATAPTSATALPTASPLPTTSTPPPPGSGTPTARTTTPTPTPQPPPTPTATPQSPTATAAPPPPDLPATAVPSPTDPPSTEQRYAFPVLGAADYGRDHHDYPATDIFADCGTPVVAPTSGAIEELSATDPWDPGVDDPASRGGLFWSLVGDDGVRYYGSHLQALAHDLAVGGRVAAGELLGTVGRTGNAAATPCHLHFGISPPRGPGDWQVRRGVVWPWPYLDAWRTGAHRSPAPEVAAWASANP